MELIRQFELINLQAHMSLKAEASRLYLSYLWWVIEPILFILVFYFVFGILFQAKQENFLLFLICGKIPFLWFSKTVTNASNSIVQNRGLIGSLDISKAIFPYVSILESLYKQWVVFGVMFALVFAFGYTPVLNWLWLIPLIIVQLLLIILFSLVGAYLVCFISDFRMLINMGMMLLLFASGVFWDVNAVEDPAIQNLLMNFNPVLFIIDGYREVILRNSQYDVGHLLRIAGTVLALLTVTHVVLHKSSRLIAHKVVGS